MREVATRCKLTSSDRRPALDKRALGRALLWREIPTPPRQTYHPVLGEGLFRLFLSGKFHRQRSPGQQARTRLNRQSRSCRLNPMRQLGQGCLDVNDRYRYIAQSLNRLTHLDRSL